MELIPAIELIDGKCVRLTEGDYATKKIYNEDPLEVAQAFEAIGLTRLHMVDLDGAKAGSPQNLKVLEKVAANTKLIIDFGGGLKTDQNVQDTFSAGAQLATVGSIAVKNPALFEAWIKQYGANKILLGADVKNEKIAIGGWLETTDVWVFDFLKEKVALGINQAFVTDISKDGRLEGPALDLYKKIITDVAGFSLIASGGVATLKDLQELAEAGLSGAIIGKAIYENRISLNELQTLNEELN